MEYFSGTDFVYLNKITKFALPNSIKHSRCAFFYGCSSIGRVVVSKTIGWEFESLHPCKTKSFCLNLMEKVKNYISETMEEMRFKVSWPSYSELQKSSVLVLVGSLVFAVVVGAVDLVYKETLEFFYNQF